MLKKETDCLQLSNYFYFKNIDKKHIINNEFLTCILNPDPTLSGVGVAVSFLAGVRMG